MKKLILGLLFSCLMFAQSSPTLNISGSTNVRPGTSVSFPISLINGNNTIASLQFTVNYTSDFSGATIVVGNGISASKQISCNPSTNSQTCVIYGINQTAIPDGLVATLSATLVNPTTVTPEIVSYASNSIYSASALIPSSAITLVAGTTGSDSVLSNCDLNGDGVTNVTDLNLLISWIFNGVTPPVGLTSDLNHDGKSNVIDMQVDIDGILGTCTATQP